LQEDGILKKKTEPLKRKRRKAESEPSALPAQLASQIVELLRTNKKVRGDHLSEQEFADAFRVSRTPVREAFRLLEDMSVLEKRPNRGYFLLRDADALEHQHLQAGESEDRVYFDIAADRLSGALPERFTENQLMRRYGVSRSRLVKYLLQMQHEGWLERLPGHGWEFQPTLNSPEVYEQSFRFRLLIEPVALLEPGYTISPDTISHLRNQQKAMLDGGIFSYSRSHTFQIGATFHETIVAAAQNPFYVDAIRRVNRLRRLMEYRLTTGRSRMIQQCKEHLALLDILETGNYSEASTYLRKHLEGAQAQKLGLAKKTGSALSKTVAHDL
jgi:DNA-binding GntR family transcriptional regulator